MCLQERFYKFFPPGSGAPGTAARWPALLILSAVFVLLLELLRLPAALLLGPMAAAILVAAAKGPVRVPRWAFFGAQGVIGCMIARSVTPSTVTAMRYDWPLFLAASLAVVVVGAALGWLLARLRILPGTTAVWGSTPGAATAMVLLADAYGADVRLVAFMQYLRVLCIALAATVVSRIWTGSAGQRSAGIVWFPTFDRVALAETLALAWLGAAVASRLRIPAGPLLLPLAIGAVLHGLGVMTIELPPWLLATSYALIGWSIGLRFTRAILVHAARALPGVAASILTLIAAGGLSAFLLVSLAGIDPLTAYLATSPGGVDSVAIIAASTKVDMPFVMALQMARLLIVLSVGPRLARSIVKWTGIAEKQG